MRPPPPTAKNVHAFLGGNLAKLYVEAPAGLVFPPTGNPGSASGILCELLDGQHPNLVTNYMQDENEPNMDGIQGQMQNSPY